MLEILNSIWNYITDVDSFILSIIVALFIGAGLPKIVSLWKVLTTKWHSKLWSCFTLTVAAVALCYFAIKFLPIIIIFYQWKEMKGMFKPAEQVRSEETKKLLDEVFEKASEAVKEQENTDEQSS